MICLSDCNPEFYDKVWTISDDLVPELYGNDIEEATAAYDDTACQTLCTNDWKCTEFWHDPTNSKCFRRLLSYRGSYTNLTEVELVKYKRVCVCM